MINYKEKMVNSIKEAGNKLIEEAENICNDYDTGMPGDIDIWINIQAVEQSSMKIEKNYVLERINCETLYLNS